MDKARLQALVDGELAPEEAAEVVLHLADNLGDQAYVDDLFAANIALLQAYNSPTHEPVPQTILETIFPPAPSSDVVQLAWYRPAATWHIAASFGGLTALAAVLTLVAFLTGTETAPGSARLAVGIINAGTPLHTLMQTAPSGEVHTLEPGAEAVILATMPTYAGYCREIELVSRQDKIVQIGLACGRAGSWKIDVVFAEVLPTSIADNGFLPAAGEEGRQLTTWLDRVGAGAVLAPDREREAISRTWN